LLECGGDVVRCDVAAVVHPDIVLIDALARLQLTARRFGCQVRLRHACGELRDLLALMGLTEVVPLCER
jgi:ABC-type transporter Mla MlaB component